MTEDRFAAALTRIEASDLSPLELMGIAESLRESNSADLAIRLYAAWLARDEADPLRCAILFNHAAALSARGDLTAARDDLLEAIRLRPDFLQASLNLGLVQERLGARTEAVAAWTAVTTHLRQVHGETIAHKRAALRQLGRVLEAAHSDPSAEDRLRECLDVDPHQRDVLQHWLNLRQRQCKWPLIQPLGSVARPGMIAGLSPLSLAAHTDDPLLQLASAAEFCRLDIARPERPATPMSAGSAALAAAPLRIGYLSSDLREHAIGLLMVELFELHGLPRGSGDIEAFVYYCGPAAEDAIHRRITAATTGRWRDISALSDDEAAARIGRDGIGILVDINGHTHSARSRLLAMRPAPVIVNWLGFPGTTGSPDHHYIIADDFIVPPGSEAFYSERVVRLPCYQPNDRRRVVSERVWSRAEAGLPEDAAVYCCFNGAQKFTPFTWRRWMSILRQVPHGVLWLMDGVPTTTERLRRLAAEQDVDPDRLVFAPRVGNPDHLARYALADLFLDTSPYGAHTTASDALWAGIPVLTVAGRGFASRVCGSLVTAAGLPELVFSTPDEYVAAAVALGHDPAARAELKRRLRGLRDSCVLFDTPLLARRLEALFQAMWRDAVAGLVPRPDLSNLEDYATIGRALDGDDREMLGVSDYRARVFAGLVERDEFCLLRPDDRLWRPLARPLVG
jgi:predicted O-linked N-acetylglucosamine transferase (SPINDLY family)